MRDDVANSFVEALLKWQGTPMTVDHTGSFRFLAQLLM